MALPAHPSADPPEAPIPQAPIPEALPRAATPPQGAGNTIPAGNSAGGSSQDYQDPVFTEDYQVLNTLNSYYGGQLLLVKTLFATAQSAGLVTATVGKSGAAYIQDLGQGGYFLDENTVQPRSLVTELQGAGIALPANVVKNYSSADAVTLAANNGNPTARAGYVTFNTTAYDPNGKVAIAARDSADTTQGAPEDAANKYMMSVYTQYILPQKKPMLSLCARIPTSSSCISTSSLSLLPKMGRGVLKTPRFSFTANPQQQMRPYAAETEPPENSPAPSSVASAQPASTVAASILARERAATATDLPP